VDASFIALQTHMHVPQLRDVATQLGIIMWLNVSLDDLQIDEEP